jgi:hypothetical protein
VVIHGHCTPPHTGSMGEEGCGKKAEDKSQSFREFSLTVASGAGEGPPIPGKRLPR